MSINQGFLFFLAMMPLVKELNSSNFFFSTAHFFKLFFYQQRRKHLAKLQIQMEKVFLLMIEIILELVRVTSQRKGGWGSMLFGNR